MQVNIFISLILLQICAILALRQYSKKDVIKLREEVRDMFQHSYEGYLKYASPYDELRPLSCDGIDTWGSYSLTLIDALDTLVTIGNYSEFGRVVNIIIEKMDFDSDINVSVFETNIRIVGGLLSAHLLSHRAGIELEPGWPCNGPLLRLAEDVAKRLLPAFDTKTGMPYGTVNLKYGVPPGETSVTCTAGVGTFIVEFGTLSRLTGDPIYEEVALNALYALLKHQSVIGLYGNHIDVQSGRWMALDAGIGGGVDSYYEYLVKGSLLLNRPELMHMFNEGRKSIEKYLKRDDWYIWVGMNKGQVTLPVFQSLEAYWPGVLSLLGETSAAMKTLHNYHTVWKQYGFLPESYNIPNAEAGLNRENYPLRPELIESVMYLYRATGDPYLLEVGEDMLRSIQHSSKTPCGYATIKNVRDHQKEDRMESFFLAETTKYLYLLFDPDNFLNNDGREGVIIETINGECLIDAGGYIFNTEAHPIDPSALRCCYDIHRESLLKDFSYKKFAGESFRYTLADTREEDVEVPPLETVTSSEEADNFTLSFNQPLSETQQLIMNDILRVLAEEKSTVSLDILSGKSTKNENQDDTDSIIQIRGSTKDVDISELNRSFRYTNTAGIKPLPPIKQMPVSEDGLPEQVNPPQPPNPSPQDIPQQVINQDVEINDIEQNRASRYFDMSSKLSNPTHQKNLPSKPPRVIKNQALIPNLNNQMQSQMREQDINSDALVIGNDPRQFRYMKQDPENPVKLPKRPQSKTQEKRELSQHDEMNQNRQTRYFDRESKPTNPPQILETLDNKQDAEIDNLDQNRASRYFDKSAKPAVQPQILPSKNSLLSENSSATDESENPSITASPPTQSNIPSEPLKEEDEDESYEGIDDSKSISNTEDIKTSNKKTIPNLSKNISVLTEFVQTLLKSTQVPKRKKFEPQELLMKIKTDGHYRNPTWSDQWELLTCKAQPFLQRMSVWGEFFST